MTFLTTCSNSRHCERSAAIQNADRKPRIWIASLPTRLAMTRAVKQVSMPQKSHSAMPAPRALPEGDDSKLNTETQINAFPLCGWYTQSPAINTSDIFAAPRPGRVFYCEANQYLCYSPMIKSRNIAGNSNMTLRTSSRKEIEKERKVVLKKLIKQFKKDSRNPEQLTDYNETTLYAAMHVASIHMDMVDRNLLEDPEIIIDPDAYAMANKAHHHLYNLYQWLGKKLK